MRQLPDATVQAQIAIAKKAADLLDLDDEAFQLTLESETMAVEHCEELATAALYAEVEALKMKAIVDMYSARKASFESKQEAIEARIIKLIAATGKKSLPTTTALLTLRSTPGPAIIDDADVLPAQYIAIPEPKILKGEIRKALISGIEVPGAHLDEPTTSLTIKVK